MEDDDGAERTYIGDGAYAKFDGFGMVLTTENGITTTNTIYLEPPVFQALLEYAGKFYDFKGSKLKPRHPLGQEI